MNIGEKLERLTDGHDRAALAAALDVPAGRLAKWITGRTRPTFETVRILARRLDVDPLWLLDDRHDFPPIQLSAAFADPTDPTIDDTTRARLALHRAIELLDGDALMRVVNFARHEMRPRVVATARQLAGSAVSA